MNGVDPMGGGAGDGASGGTSPTATGGTPSDLPSDAQVGLYRTFELTVANDTPYDNRFGDVELAVTYSAPSGQTVDFFGFFDGDGQGGGDARSGQVWKLRFMPDELGPWRYSYSWSDGTPGGEGEFESVQAGAGKGILRPYEGNPRWFAYNGTDPVWLKSYYETGHGAISQPFDWIAENVYQPMLDRGYNHLQVNWLMPLCCEEQFYTDGPAQSKTVLRLYDNGEASSTMQLDVWHLVERHVSWLNARNVGLHMFLGFDGGRNGGPAWEDLSEDEKRFYVRYVVARLGPYANIAGWNFTWEVPGDRESHELGLARLLQQEDVFDHLRTYEDEAPNDNEYGRPEYTFAAIENHGMYASDRDSDRAYWKEPWTHHEACLVGYVTGKPVYMSEGNALWRRYWQAKTGATRDDLRRSAWGCATAGASFNWNGHTAEDGLTAFGPDGLPFHGDDNPYAASARELDVLAEVMTGDVEFHRMGPHDELLSGHDPEAVWCLAETGRQYLVFSAEGRSFQLSVAVGDYVDNVWIDAKSGAVQEAPAVTGATTRLFQPPGTGTDWVLVLRTGS